MVLTTKTKDGATYELHLQFIPLTITEEDDPHPDGTPRFTIQGQLGVLTKKVTP